jgi:hypothetical protein
MTIQWPCFLYHGAILRSGLSLEFLSTENALLHSVPRNGSKFGTSKNRKGFK